MDGFSVERGTHLPLFIPVHDARKDRVHIGGGADDQQNDEEQRLEIEDGRLQGGNGRLASQYRFLVSNGECRQGSRYHGGPRVGVGRLGRRGTEMWPERTWIGC